MKAIIDNLLNRVTMYRLMLYYLATLLLGSIALGAVGLIPYAPSQIIWTAGSLIVFCYLFNWFFVTLFRAKQNPESRFITALILALIIGPVSGAEGMIVLFVAAFVAMGSKYVIACHKRHIFNPAAVGALVVALVFGFGSSWWVGNPYLAPIILLGGLLVAYKMDRSGMVGVFMATFVTLVAITVGISWMSVGSALRILANPFVFTPAAFFALVMLVEPMTSPQKRPMQYYYAALVAVLAVGYGMLEVTAPYSFELALLSGNLFNRMFQFGPMTTLTLRKKEMVANNTMSFWFEPSHPVSFVPGQFMQWELPHRNPDNRGTRRFFTICSSPTEAKVMLTTKFAEPSSTFKSALRAMKEQDQMTALNVSGDFVLPEDPATPCVFIAGGIGVTPFRSMVKYMLDKNLSRPITLLYSNKTADDIAFKPLFDEAVQAGWLKVVYTITESIPYGWRGRTGYITADVIREEIPDLADHIFYLSGPQPMVSAFVTMLSDIGIARDRIKTDYFPGYTETYQRNA